MEQKKLTKEDFLTLVNLLKENKENIELDNKSIEYLEYFCSLGKKLIEKKDEKIKKDRCPFVKLYIGFCDELVFKIQGITEYKVLLMLLKYLNINSKNAEIIVVQSELAERLKMDKSQLSRALSKLENDYDILKAPKGYVNARKPIKRYLLNEKYLRFGRID